MKKGFTVKPYKHDTLKFLVRGKVAGKWARKFFSTKGEADTYARQQNTALLNQGREGVEFSSALRVAALEANELLAPFGVSLLDAVKDYVTRANERRQSASLESVVGEVIAKRERASSNVKYVKALRFYGEKFVAYFPGRSICEISTKEAQDFITSLGHTHPTTINYARDITRKFFSHAVRVGYALRNPVLAVEKLDGPDAEPGIYTPEEVRFILDNAPAKLVPFFAIGFFAGIRTSEIRRLDWSEIDLESGLIDMKARKTKTARRRWVKIEPCLAAWLRPYALPSGKVAPPGGNESLVSFRARFPEMTNWPHNGMRHSFCSYHLAKWKDAPRLALEMGHTTTEMIFAHYRNLVKDSAAEAYWQTFPTKEQPDRQTVRSPWEVAPYQVRKNNVGKIYVKWPTEEKMRYKTFSDEASAQAWADEQNAPWHRGESLPGVRERRLPGYRAPLAK